MAPSSMYTFSEIMCSEPNTINGQQVACRTCNQCLATYKNGWVARCMAERAVAGHTMAIGLSYRDLPNGEKPLGARVFRYKDIQRWLYKIRFHYKDKFKKTGEVRYVVCGERGSKGSKRLHWHVVLFSDEPIVRLGKWERFHTGKPLEGVELEKRLIWSMWDHGHVYLQQPDQSGIEYCLKYILMDQFGAQKSKGTLREGKTSNNAASFFRMSKKPPIGDRFLDRKLSELRELNSVNPSSGIKIPDYKGYWYPTGNQREKWLLGLKSINDECLLKHGYHSRQWSSLIHSVSDPDAEARGDANSDLETLLIGEVENVEITPERIEALKQLEAKRIASARNANLSRALVETCGRVVPCQSCARFHSAKNLAELELERRKWHAKYCERFGQDPESYQSWTNFDTWWKTRGRASRGCLHRHPERVSAALNAARGAYLLQKRIGGKTRDRGEKG